jgi:mRNA interferase RelE/StbE
MPSILQVRIESRVRKYLDTIPKKHAGQIARKILDIASDPIYRTPFPLRGYPQYYRAKCGEYRCIYKIEDNVLLLIILVGKRNDDAIYKDFEKLMR